MTKLWIEESWEHSTSNNPQLAHERATAKIHHNPFVQGPHHAYPMETPGNVMWFCECNEAFIDEREWLDHAKAVGALPPGHTLRNYEDSMFEDGFDFDIAEELTPNDVKPDSE